MFSATVPAATVINRESVFLSGPSQMLQGKITDLAIGHKKAKVLGSGPHRPAGFFWEYPLGILPSILNVIFRLVDLNFPSS